MNDKVKHDLLSGKTKPKFGNTEHIKIVKQAEQYTQKFQAGIDICDEAITKEVEVLFKFDCPNCFRPTEVALYTSNLSYSPSLKEFVIDDDLAQEFECHRCSQDFRFENGVLKAESEAANG